MGRIADRLVGEQGQTLGGNLENFTAFEFDGGDIVLRQQAIARLVFSQG
jgi:hypothetical protein